MVQYKKDDIKKKIDNAALYVFAEKGYKDTGISDIAKKAHVSVGNIYRYYKGKDDIFYSSIVQPDFIDMFKSITLKKISSAKDTMPGLSEGSQSHLFFLMNEEFIEFIISNRERMLIIFNGAKGTRYEPVKNEIIDYLIKTVKENYSKQDNKVIFDIKNEAVIRTIYIKFIEMMMDVLKESSTPTEIKSSLNIINTYHLFGVTNLFN